MRGRGCGTSSAHIKGEPRQSSRSLLTLFSGVVSLAGRELLRLKSNTLTLSLRDQGCLFYVVAFMICESLDNGVQGGGVKKTLRKLCGKTSALLQGYRLDAQT